MTETTQYDDLRWIAVCTHVNAEQKAAFHLQRQHYDVYLPQHLKLVRHARRQQHLPRPLFPRYLFVPLRPNDHWRPIQSTLGVTSIVFRGDRPANVPADIIEEIRAREDENGHVRINFGRSFSPGQQIRVELGPFSGVEGVFECRNEVERVTVLLNILGRQVRARLPIEAMRTIN